jgi:glucuronate isomerase
VKLPKPLHFSDDRLFPADPASRALARKLYANVRDLPIISPHGHTDPSWFSDNQAFANATDLLLAPDHYIYRMFYSQGIELNDLGVASRNGLSSANPRKAWRLFADHFYLFRGTPSWIWLNHVFSHVFGLEIALDSSTADRYFDHINEKLATAAFRPRALFERFNIEVLATTESPHDDLGHHAALGRSGWKGRVITTYRPDPVIDCEHEDFPSALKRFGELANCDVFNWSGYLQAHRVRRQAFKAMGATATDHGHPTAATADLSGPEIERLFATILSGKATPQEAEMFRAQMLTEMAKMSLEDGMVMQIHPGAMRNHNRRLFDTFGRDKGADIPTQTNYVSALKPLLDRLGNERDLTIILFTLDETVYARELAPLSGHYPALRLGPAWWFHDSPEGMMRFREQTTETAGFYNTVGFNDDTRAFLSIPARHDVARRIDCTYLARLVAEHRLSEEDAVEVAQDLAYRLVKKAYKFDAPPAALVRAS